MARSVSSIVEIVASRPAGQPDIVHRNLSVIVGRLSRPLEQRILPSGETATTFDVMVRAPVPFDRSPGEPSIRTESIPVTWFCSNDKELSLEPGDDVLVVGSVRRRFFRQGGITQSRTDVVATVVVAARRRAAVRRALAAAASQLGNEP